MSKTKDLITWILFALVIVAIYLFALDLPLLGPDEPRYAQVAREMFERGDWVTTTLGGHHWFEKPALLYWLQIFFYNIFGVNEFAARLGSALFGLGTIFSLYLLGKTTNNEQRTTNEFAKWLGLIAASSLGLLVFSRGASFDIMITFPITASLVSFFIWENKSEKQLTNNYLLLTLFYFFIGVGLIAKGLIGIVFPLAIVAFYYVLRWKLPNRTFILSLFWGTIVSVLVASIWYLPMYLTNGWKFIDEFFIQHHFQRYTSNKYKHPQPFWFYWVIFPLFTIPWIPFFFAAIWNFVKNIFNHRDTETQSFRKGFFPFSSSPLLLFSLSWLLVPLVFFSLSGSKLPGYIMPAVPAAIILTADFVYQFVQKAVWRKYALQFLAFLMFAVVAFLLQFVVPNFAEQDSTKHLVQIANTNGYQNEKIINFQTISHNIEFYGNGRLVRNEKGEQRKFESVEEIIAYLKTENSNTILVLVPHEFSNKLTENQQIVAKILDKTGELDIVFIKKK